MFISNRQNSASIRHVTDRQYVYFFANKNAVLAIVNVAKYLKMRSWSPPTSVWGGCVWVGERKRVLMLRPDQKLETSSLVALDLYKSPSYIVFI